MKEDVVNAVNKLFKSTYVRGFYITALKKYGTESSYIETKRTLDEMIKKRQLRKRYEVVCDNCFDTVKKHDDVFVVEEVECEKCDYLFVPSEDRCEVRYIRP